MTTEERSRIMRAVKGRDTDAEMIVRRLLHGLGYRYRLHGKELPGKPDVTFRSRRKVIFVHGCFWHGHDCKRGDRMPKSNRAYWTAKIARNKVRDERHGAVLAAMGWSVLTVWECELRDRNELVRRLCVFLEEDTVQTAKLEILEACI
jgi:DNA mismatch endonuclease, patch repair protein